MAISDPWEKMADRANSKWGIFRNALFPFDFHVKRDEKGFIMDPLDERLKIGWGATPKEAFLNMIERNKNCAR